VAGSLISLWTLHLLLPIAGLLLAAMLSAFFREVVESRDIQAETGNILRSLVKEGRSEHQSPRGPQERLHLARLLQERLIHDRNLRRTLLEGLGEGVILWDGEGRPLLSNSSFGQFWGEIPTLPEMLHTLGSTGIESSSDGNPPAHLEHLNRSLEIHFQDLGDGHLAVVRDHTAERELDRRRREMQRLVSHELKTPLASLAGFGSLLERYSLTDEELRRTAGLIRSEAERLGEMVRTFLDLERLGAGWSDTERESVDLPLLVKQRCEILSAVSQEKNIKLEFMANGPALISGVPQLLAQVIDNLIGNAVKFSPEDTEVGIEVTQGPGSIVFSVSDSGPGIPPEALPQLFERFYRVPGTGTQGSGLGLALVREVLEHHQATVEVESVVGTGSTFTVKFPSPETPEEE
jgi:signal transduction histidine kinase